jgi:hypothetical protein
MLHFTHLLTPEHLEAGLIGCGILAKIGGGLLCLLRMLRPGTGRHRRPRR